MRIVAADVRFQRGRIARSHSLRMVAFRPKSPTDQAARALREFRSWDKVDIGPFFGHVRLIPRAVFRRSRELSSTESSV